MMDVKCFKIGSPKTLAQLKLSNQHNALFLFSEDGTEWYSSQQSFARDTIKIAYDDKGIIRSIAVNKEVSTLWPVGLSVAEVADTTANRRADISGNWVFDGKKIDKRVYTTEEHQEQARTEQRARIAAAAKMIAPLQDAVDLDMASEAERVRLDEWKRYRIMLSRLDFSDALKINWPAVPHD
ncbi:tail fiber assembly protein [Serratia liquefaciens]|uniref:tail fiber assembly protein n=1 Tax=Serratia liquefaciens TaxID=614 RepID=UPI003AF3B472